MSKRAKKNIPLVSSLLFGLIGIVISMLGLFFVDKFGSLLILFGGIVIYFSIFVFFFFIMRYTGIEIQSNSRWQYNLTIALFNIILVVSFGQGLFWVLLQKELNKSSKIALHLFEYALERQEPSSSELSLNKTLFGTGINYSEHHYLNYALNPLFPYGGKLQYNEKFRIRRTEAIRARNQVKWRTLVLGGSTTFCEMVPHEDETWVKQLEIKIRDKYGKDYDVINGGVGGYNIQENFIHYITLLTHLNPDVVILFNRSFVKLK